MASFRVCLACLVVASHMRALSVSVSGVRRLCSSASPTSWQYQWARIGQMRQWKDYVAEVDAMGAEALAHDGTSASAASCDGEGNEQQEQQDISGKVFRFQTVVSSLLSNYSLPACMNLIISHNLVHQAEGVTCARCRNSTAVHHVCHQRCQCNSLCFGDCHLA